MKMLNPVHPGRFLRTEIIEAHELTVTDGDALRESIRCGYGHLDANAEFL